MRAGKKRDHIPIQPKCLDATETGLLHPLALALVKDEIPNRRDPAV
jgi:hypothetical protein